MKPRFLLDEHINRAIQRQLRRLDVRIDVLAIGDSGAPDAGTPDPDILDWLERNSYILVTRNRRTIPAYLTSVGLQDGTFLASFGFAQVSASDA